MPLMFSLVFTLYDAAAAITSCAAMFDATPLTLRVASHMARCHTDKTYYVAAVVY